MSSPLPRLRATGAGELRTLAFVAAVILLLVLFRQLVFAVHARESGWTYVGQIGSDFLQHFAAALLMFVVIEPVRQRAPADGPARIALLVIAVLVAAALATTVRTVWMVWMHGSPGSQLWPAWHLMFLRFAVLAGMLVSVGEFHRREVISLEAMRAAEADRSALEQETMQARLKTLEAQIEPHFLFNTLATVRRLLETDPVAGEAMLEQLMRYLQVALPSLRNEPSTLGREARIIGAYLDLQKVRMGERLEYAIDIDDSLSALEVPPMMLLTLVENAVKHGLAPQRRGGRIEVGARSDEGSLRLEVADTGAGFGSDSMGGGTGLANIRARLAAMFGGAAELSLSRREPNGVLASIRLPLPA